MLAPISSLEPANCLDSTENALEISGKTAIWYHSGTPFRTFTLDEPITMGVLSHFNNNKCVVLVCDDLVYTFSENGRTGCIGLQFTPESICACESGVAFMFKQQIYLMSDPDSFFGLVVPSSTTTIESDDELIYFGERGISVAMLQNGSQIKLLHIRKLTSRIQQRTKRTSSLAIRRHSSLANQLQHDARIMSGVGDEGVLEKLQIASASDLQLEKEAVITIVNTIEFPHPPQLQVVAQRFGNQQALYLFDSISNELHISVYANETKKPILSEIRKVNGIAKLKGFEIGNTVYPLIVILSQDGNLYLHSSFFQIADLQIDIPPCQSISSGGDGNSFIADSVRYSLIEDNNSGLIGKCFEILAHLLEPTATMYWLMAYQGMYQLMRDESSWSVFFIASIACLSDVESIEEGEEISTWVHAVHHVQTTHPRISFDHIASMIIICFHMLREEYLLCAHSDDNVDSLGLLLSFLTHHAGWDGWTLYYGYSHDLEYLLSAAPQGARFTVPAEKIYSAVPNIYATLISHIAPPQIDYPKITSLKHIFYQTLVCQSLFSCLSNSEVTMEQMIDLLNGLQLTPEIIGNFAEGVRVCIMEIISSLQMQKSLGGGPIEQFKLLGRRDFEATASLNRQEGSLRDDDNELPLVRNAKFIDGYMTLVFDKDRRFRQTCQLLDHSLTHECHLSQPIDLSDHDWLGIQNTVQRTYVIRTLSLAFGVCAMYYSSEAPFISERLALPEPEFKLLMTETNSLLTFDVKSLPSNVLIWSFFHFGVSIGLRISKESENVTGSWIVYNKPEKENVCLRHAGFLLGLGINGHLRKLEEWHTYNYMGGKDPVTSVALLIGLPASYLGTMDSKLTKVLSVHIAALLPRGSNDLNVHTDVRTAAVIGVGLLYFGTKNRRMTEVFLSEISSSDMDKHEFYRYACGLSLGLMNLHKGSELKGVVDSQMVEKLEQIATFVTDDIQKYPTSHMSSNGATIALMLTFLQTNNENVAAKLRPPNSRVMANYGRPDLLFTRAMAYHLIMWDSISNTADWVKRQISPHLFPEDTSLGVEKLPYLNILGGVATAMCLKYAGTQDLTALNTVLQIMDELIDLTEVSLDESGVEVANKDSRPDLVVALANVSYILSSLAMAAATIVVSSGNLELLRRLRILHGRGLASIRLDALFNLNVGVSQGLGMLFLGGSQYSFDQSPKSIGFLSISVGMLASAGKEMMNWQLLRYFWAFAARNQSIILRDVNTNAPVKAKISVTDGTEVIEMDSPALLPCNTKIVEFTHPDYLPLVLELNDDHLPAKIFNSTRVLYIQKKPSIPLPDTLEKCLAKDETDKETAKSISSAVRHLNIMSQIPDKRASYMWNLRLLFTFTDFWASNSDGLKFIPSREIDMLKLNVWQVKQNRP